MTKLYPDHEFSLNKRELSNGQANVGIRSKHAHEEAHRAEPPGHGFRNRARPAANADLQDSDNSSGPRIKIWALRRGGDGGGPAAIVPDPIPAPEDDLAPYREFYTRFGTAHRDGDTNFLIDGQSEPWDFPFDGLATDISGSVTLTVDALWVDEQLTADLHLAPVEDELKWFADCGDPL